MLLCVYAYDGGCARWEQDGVQVESGPSAGFGTLH